MVKTKTDLVGQTISEGRYVVKSRLGTGSMGHVYLAEDNRLEVDVVIKIPTDTRLADPEFLKRFQLESRFITRLSHPNIVKVFDVGVHDEIPYFVMQFVGGGSLSDRMVDSRRVVRPQQPATLKQWIGSIAKALDFIHQEGVIHRDVKPANILYDEYSNAYLSDFGLSKILTNADENNSAMTAAGAVVGTPNYVAPEIVLGKDYDGRADQYSLATTVYEVLTGRAPLEGPTASATMVNQTTKEPPPLMKYCPDVPPKLNQLVLKAMSKKPEDRFSNCEHFADEVIRVITGGSSVLASAQAQSSQSSSTLPNHSSGSAPPRFLIDKTARGEGNRIPCPQCGKILVLKSEYAGMKASCGQCESPILISKDLTELSTLKKNPAFQSSVHKSPYDSDNFGSTVLSTEVFGLELGQKSALAVSGILLVSMVVAGVFFGLQLMKPDKNEIGIGKLGSEGPKTVERVIPYALSIDPANNAWVSAASKRFARSATGRNTRLELTHTEIGGPFTISSKADAWIPHSSYDWQVAALAHEGALSIKQETICNSPLVILMWQQRQILFSAKYGDVTLQKLVKAAMSSGGWQDIAGPSRADWGLFYFKTPALGTSGGSLIPVLSLAQELKGTASPLEQTDLLNESFSQLLTDWRRLSPRSSTTEDPYTSLLKQMHEQGPRKVDAIVVPEYLALQWMSQIEANHPGQRLTVINLPNGHPFQVNYYINQLEENNQNSERLDAAIAFLGFVKNFENQAELLKSGYRPANSDVSLSTSGSPFLEHRTRQISFVAPSYPQMPSDEVMTTLLDLIERQR